MRFFRVPSILPFFFKSYLWRKSTEEQTIYLTFDDGPVPEATPYVLEILRQYEAKATFFCVGDNIRKHPQILADIVEQGHQVGNHTYNHLNGWKHNVVDYLDNVAQCADILPSAVKFFRPPYGKLSPKQSEEVKKIFGYQIVMWDLLTYDFDTRLSPEKCLQKAKKYTRNGSIVVFHDSIKSIDILQQILAQYLEWATTQGYKFGIL
jgi:peptidoglycan-N-acetylglucosamine deacetylase